jgi:UDP-N-acetylglucosamine 2-epimerase
MFARKYIILNNSEFLAIQKEAHIMQKPHMICNSSQKHKKRIEIKLNKLLNSVPINVVSLLTMALKIVLIY